jgi:hypothetical protein
MKKIGGKSGRGGDELLEEKMSTSSSPRSPQKWVLSTSSFYSPCSTQKWVLSTSSSSSACSPQKWVLSTTSSSAVLHRNGCCLLLLLLNKNVCCEDQVILQHFIQQALTDTSNQKTNCLLKWKKQNLDLVLHCKSGSCVTTILQIECCIS